MHQRQLHARVVVLDNIHESVVLSGYAFDSIIVSDERNLEVLIRCAVVEIKEYYRLPTQIRRFGSLTTGGRHFSRTSPDVHRGLFWLTQRKDRLRLH